MGEESLKTAITHMNIGDLYLDWGKLDQAEHHSNIALRLRTLHRRVMWIIYRKDSTVLDMLHHIHMRGQH